MTGFGQPVHTDVDGIHTTARYGTVGDGTSQWFETAKILDGDDVTQGAKADAAVTNPASSGSVIGFLKGLLTILGVGATSTLKLEDAAHATGDAGIMALGVRNDARTSRAGTDGDYSPIAVGPAGGIYSSLVPAAESAWSPSSSDSSSLEASRVVKASSGKLFKLRFINTNGSTRYLQVFNNASLPADGVAPVIVVPVLTGAMVELDFTGFGRFFSSGITVCNSSTLATKTIGSADSWFNAQYL